MLMEKLESNQLFSDCAFVTAQDGAYVTVADWRPLWYPLLGLPGSVGTDSLLFCRLQPDAEKVIQKQCLNGVISKLRIHRSGRVNGPDTMLVLASDLMREFEVCQIPLMSGEDITEFINSIRELSNPSAEGNAERSGQKGLSDRYKNFPITIAGADDPIYKGGVTINSFRKPSPQTSPSSADPQAKIRSRVKKSPKKA